MSPHNLRHGEGDDIEDNFGYKMATVFPNYALFEGGAGIVGTYKMPNNVGYNSDEATKVHQSARRDIMRLLSKKMIKWMLKNGLAKHRAGEIVIQLPTQYLSFNTIDAIISPWKELAK